MAYSPYYNGGWKSGEVGGTPITPEALNHMDDGIQAALTGDDVVNNLTSNDPNPVSSGGVYNHIVAPGTGTITKTTKSSSGTLDFATCNKKGDFVSVSGRVYNLPGTTTAIGSFFSIPEGYRPPATVYVFGYMQINNVGTIPVLAEITPEGSVNLGYSASSYVSQVGFSGFYKI